MKHDFEDEASVATDPAWSSLGEAPGTERNSTPLTGDDEIDGLEWEEGESASEFAVDPSSGNDIGEGGYEPDADHQEVASSGAEFALEFDSLSESELDAALDAQVSDAPEFAIPDEDDDVSYDLDDGQQIEVLPELGAQPEFLAAILPALASAALPLVMRAGKGAIKSAIKKLPKHKRRKYRAGKHVLKALHPAVKIFLDTVRQKETSIIGASEESAYEDPAVVAEIARTMEIVLGADDRTRVSPTTGPVWRKICALRIETADGAVALGTGFLVGPRTVLTAGHCVYAHNHGGWVKRIEVIPGANGNKKPFGSWTSSSFRSVAGWTKRKVPASDYGCIQLPATADTRRLGRFGIARAVSRRELLGRRVTIAGFPGEKPFAQMWKSNDQVKAVSSKVLVYRNDTTGGMSGSPVFVTQGGRRQVVGIHNYGASSGNSATRINSRCRRNIARWVRSGSETAMPFTPSACQ